MYPLGMESREEVLQSGTDIYSSALALEPSSNTIMVWVDKPLKKHKKIQDKQDGGLVNEESQGNTRQHKEKDVPLYDRCIASLSSEDPENPGGFVSRCFNCGSYSHTLRSCSRPHSATVIRDARNTASSKRCPRPQTPSRYYQRSPGGKFNDLKPGKLSLEARKAIGIGELDPPPWLHRMREIGYPPGYLENIEDDSSGVQIIDDENEAAPGKESSKDANYVEKRISVEELMATQKMTVDYPGINAPIPEKADQTSWVACPEMRITEARGYKRSYHQISQMYSSGSGLVSPQSPWVGQLSDPNLRGEGGYFRSQARGPAQSQSKNTFDEVESQRGKYNHNLNWAVSPVFNMNQTLSINPAIQWSNTRVCGSSSLVAEGNYYYDARVGMQTYHNPNPPSSSGLVSPISGMFQSLGAAESMSSTSHFYSGHDYDHNQTQVAHFSNGQSESQIVNPAWLKAQSALDAIQLGWSPVGLRSAPDRVSAGALQNCRDPRVQDQLGRRS